MSTSNQFVLKDSLGNDLKLDKLELDILERLKLQTGKSELELIKLALFLLDRELGTKQPQFVPVPTFVPSTAPYIPPMYPYSPTIPDYQPYEPGLPWYEITCGSDYAWEIQKMPNGGVYGGVDDERKIFNIISESLYELAK